MRPENVKSPCFVSQRWYSGLGMFCLAVPQLLALSWIICTTQPTQASNPRPSSKIRAPRAVDAGSVYGKIQLVDSFPDYKVQVVDSFPDLKVMKVSSFSDGPGKWQIVDSFPDYKIQIVSSSADFKIQYVNSFPGTP